MSIDKVEPYAPDRLTDPKISTDIVSILCSLEKRTPWRGVNGKMRLASFEGEFHRFYTLLIFASAYIRIS